MFCADRIISTNLTGWMEMIPKGPSDIIRDPLINYKSLNALMYKKLKLIINNFFFYTFFSRYCLVGTGKTP